MSQIVKSLKPVAKHLGKSLRTVQRYARAGMPRIAGGYDLGQCEAWLKKTRYAGASLRLLESDAEVLHLVEVAAQELRHGLLHLCQAYLKARGVNRERLLDQATKGVLKGTLLQLGLLKEKEGGAAQQRRNEK